MPRVLRQTQIVDRLATAQAEAEYDLAVAQYERATYAVRNCPPNSPDHLHLMAQERDARRAWISLGVQMTGLRASLPTPTPQRTSSKTRLSAVRK